VAALHASEIPHGFLVNLGPGFLRRLYARVARSGTAFLVVDEDAEGVAGFVAVAERTGTLYREFLVHDGIAAGLAAAPRVLRAPRRTWETLRYGGSGGDDLPPAEILAVAVSPRRRGLGVGAALVDAATAELRRRGVPAARVVTDAGNEAALALYARCGFRPHSTAEVHAGVSQEVLVWP
jgi:ribosomal protein S18 acetylase RimI-like enzyme